MNIVYTLPRSEFAFENTEEQEEIHQRVCKCGHKFYQHAFLMLYDSITHSNHYISSQCVFCGYDHETEHFDCEKFEEAK